MTLINDPRADMNHISSELIKLEGKRIDLESTRSKLNDELNSISTQNRVLESSIAQKKAELMNTTTQKQDSLKEAQNHLELQISNCKKEQAELKTKINELLRMNEEVV